MLPRPTGPGAQHPAQTPPHHFTPPPHPTPHPPTKCSPPRPGAVLPVPPGINQTPAPTGSSQRVAHGFIDCFGVLVPPGARLGRGARRERGGGRSAAISILPLCTGWVGMAPNKTLYTFSIYIYKYIIYIYLCRYIYISSLSGKHKRLICLHMHDQSHQPMGTAGGEGCAPPPAGTLRARGAASCIPRLLLVRSHPARVNKRRGKKLKKSCSKSAGELVVTWPVPGGDCRPGTGEMVALPQDRGCCVGEGGRRHPVKRQSLDKAKKTKIKNSDRPQTRRFATQNQRASGPQCRWAVLAPGCRKDELGDRDTVIGLCSPTPPPPPPAGWPGRAPRVSAVPPAGPGTGQHPGGRGGKGPQNGADLREGRVRGTPRWRDTSPVPQPGMSPWVPALCHPTAAGACDTSPHVPACCPPPTERR